MARRGKGQSRTRASKESEQQTQVQVQEQEEDTNTKATKGEHSKMAALSQDAIAEILAGSRTRGAGTEVISEFLKSEEPGIEVDLNSGPLAGKAAGAAYTTLVNAKKRTRTDESGATVLAMPEAAKVRVIKRNLGEKGEGNEDWHVFLINTDLVDVAA